LDTRVYVEKLKSVTANTWGESALAAKHLRC